MMVFVIVVAVVVAELVGEAVVVVLAAVKLRDSNRFICRFMYSLPAPSIHTSFLQEDHSRFLKTSLASPHKKLLANEVGRAAVRQRSTSESW